MNTHIPFAVYDFFGYLAAGFLIIAAADFALDGSWLLKDDLAPVFAVLWTGAAYIIGHLNAGLASAFWEKWFVRRVLRAPEETLFSRTSSCWRYIFPGYYATLPQETRSRVLQKARERADIEHPGRGLFFHCHPIAKRDTATLDRLGTFLNLYGFCRNISMASLVAAALLVVVVYMNRKSGNTNYEEQLWWAAAAVIVAIGMLYRYLKFFRHYAVEVFMTYAESD